MENRKRSLLIASSEQDSVKRKVTESDVLDLSKKSSGVNLVTTGSILDLSKKDDEPNNSKMSDIICLSDDDEEELALLEKSFEDDSPDQVKSRKRFLTKLLNDLRNEEARLLLLRKLKASQSTMPPQTKTVTNNTNQVKMNVTQPGANSIQRSGSLIHNNSVGINRNSLSAPRIVGNSTSLSHNSTTTILSNSSVDNINKHDLSSQGQNNSTSTTSSNGHNSTSSTTPTVRVTRAMALQVLEQRFSAKKTLLRKETEKSLLETSTPCPSHTELGFIPNIATNEFVALVGMEEVVKSIQDHDRILKGGKLKDVSYTITPFTCVECGTDFTPLWKRDKSGGSNVICESCLSFSQRTRVQEEYVDKVKQILKRTGQQEKNLEKEYKDVANNPTELAKFQREQERQLQAQQPRQVSNTNVSQSVPVSSLSRNSIGGLSNVTGKQSAQVASNMVRHGIQTGNSRSGSVTSSNVSTKNNNTPLNGPGSLHTQSSRNNAQSARSSTTSNNSSSSASNNTPGQRSLAAAQAQALMNLGIFQSGSNLPNDYHRQQMVQQAQQAILSQLALLQQTQSQSPNYLASGLSQLSNASYLAMLQSWAANGATGLPTNQQSKSNKK